MTNPRWQGIFPAITTKFHADESIDVRWTRPVIRSRAAWIRSSETNRSGIGSSIAADLR